MKKRDLSETYYFRLLDFKNSLFLTAFLLVTFQVASANASQHKILFLVPSKVNAEYQLNERNTLTNKLDSGWLVAAKEKVNFLAYILVQEHIADLREIKTSLLHFTTSQTQCGKTNQYVFPLTFMKGKSKLHNTGSALVGFPNSIVSTNLSQYPYNSTLLVANFDVSLNYHNDKYYVCLYFVKKNSPDDQLEMSSNEEISIDNTNMKVNMNLFVHQGSQNVYTQIITTKDFLPIYIVIIFYIILLCFSALFSGLNLGLMSLDLTELNILKKCGSVDKHEKTYATKIYPLRKKGNLLLCTILLGNVLVNSTSTLILGNYVQGLMAALGSTLLIVIFGEIIPQAVCSRHGLAVGAHTRYITYFMMAFTFVISYPLSKVLDFFLGKEIASVYSRDKVRELMRQVMLNKDGRHGDDEDGGLEHKQFKLITGALDFKKKTVKDIMVPLKDVFSLDINSILDFDTFKLILHHGYSRIPVYEQTKENLVGMILIQDLLLNDPADKVPLRAVMDYYQHRVPRCTIESKLSTMFDLFRKGDSHMAFVYTSTANSITRSHLNLNNMNSSIYNLADLSPLKDSNNNVTTASKRANLGDELNNLMNDEAVGILTLENIIEELVQSDIMDEADTRRERRRKRARDILKGKLKNSASLSNENLNIFVTEVDQTNKPQISTQIRKALYYFLAFCVRPFSDEFISPKLLEAFLKQPELIIEKRNLSKNENDQTMFLYQYGIECDYFLIILDGSAQLLVGNDSNSMMEINAGLFSFYGVNALLDESVKDFRQLQKQLASSSDHVSPTTPPNSSGSLTHKLYKPEFSLMVTSYCVYIKITRKEWLDVVKKSQLLKLSSMSDIGYK